MAPVTTSAQALSQLQQDKAGQQAPQDILTSQEQALGVPQAQQQVSGLRQAITNTTNLLNQVAPSIYGRTQNSLVTDAQAGAQIANESAPIQTKLAGLNTSEGNAASDLSNIQSQAGTLAGLTEQGNQDKLTYDQNLYNSLYGSEQDAQAEADKQAAAAASSSGSSSSSSSGRAPSAADQLQSSVQSMASELKSVAGSDGYVSPASYAQGMKAWVQAGLSPSQYDQYMSIYRNPSNPHYLLSNGKYV